MQTLSISDHLFSSGWFEFYMFTYSFGVGIYTSMNCEVILESNLRIFVLIGVAKGDVFHNL